MFNTEKGANTVSLINEFYIEKLKVKIYSNRSLMGAEAANKAEEIINELLNEKSEVRIIFAAAPSQNDFLDELVQKNIDWSKIVAFHMDEYIGLAKDSDKLFKNYLNRRMFDKVNFKEVNFIETYKDDIEAECERYSKLLSEAQIDIVFMGIGENGHIAFNDPHIANFNDPKLVKIVEIDKNSRRQQVNDKTFSNISDVPKNAVTISVPALLSATHRLVIVPDELKAKAVFKTLYSVMSNACPSTILRSADNTTLYLDKDSSNLLSLISMN